MNPIIEKQLDKIKQLNNLQIDETETGIHISKATEAVQQSLVQDNCYLISVADYILNPPQGFTLHTNWNNNIAPKHKVMKIDVSKVMGKMIKVNSVGYDLKNNVDTNDFWEGWLPEKSITIIERL